MTSVITEEQEMGQLWVLFSHPEIIHRLILFMGFPGGLVVKNSAPPRVYFPVLCKFWQLCGGLNGDLLQEGSCHIQVCCTQSP